MNNSIVVIKIIVITIIMLNVKIVYFPVDRKLVGHETFVVILNVGTEQETITLTDYIKNIPQVAVVRISSINAWYAEK